MDPSSSAPAARDAIDVQGAAELGPRAIVVAAEASTGKCPFVRRALLVAQFVQLVRERGEPSR